MIVRIRVLLSGDLSWRQITDRALWLFHRTACAAGERLASPKIASAAGNLYN